MIRTCNFLGAGELDDARGFDSVNVGVLTRYAQHGQKVTIGALFGRFLCGVTAPGDFSYKFTLLEMITELSYRHRARVR